jgi:hypothetical protein
MVPVGIEIPMVPAGTGEPPPPPPPPDVAGVARPPPFAQAVKAKAMSVSA